MNSLLFALALSCIICLVLMPAARALALRLGFVDQPDGHRKIHRQPTAVSGGLAILISTIASLTALLLTPHNSVADDLRSHWPTMLSLLLGALVICALGVADDCGRLRGRHKLLGQIVASGMVVSCGVWVRTVQIFGVEMTLGWVGIPFTVLFLVVIINSLNLLDGMDGLLGSVGVILALSLAAMAWLAGHWWAGATAAALAGALFGFLRYNLVRATIFLGDSGSMLIGLVLGTLSIHCSLKAPSTLAMALPLGLLVLPFFDTTAAIVRRKLTGRSIYTTDRGHLHHCLQRSGFSTAATVALISVGCLLACGSVLASRAFDNEWIALLTAASIIATLMLTKWFGYAEAQLIKGRLWSLVLPNHCPKQMEVRLQGTAGWDSLWDALKHRASGLNLSGMLLDVNAPFLHEGYHARWGQLSDGGGERPQWHVEIPMTVQGRAAGRLLLSGQPDAQPVWVKIAAVMLLIERFNSADSAAVGVSVNPAAMMASTTRESQIGLEIA